MTINFLESNHLLIMALLGLVTFGLAIYLGVLMKKINMQKKAHEKRLKEHENDLQEKAEYYKESIIFISKATLQGQCEPSEACIRIHRLLEIFPSIASEDEVLAISNMHKELESFDMLEARKELSKQEIFDQDKKRFEVEKKYKSQLDETLKYLITRFESLH